MHPDAQRWNRKYRGMSGPGRFQVDGNLQRHAERLGAPGRGLEVACGSAAHALWLAERGWDMTGIDVSVEGLRLARGEAGRRGVSLALAVADAARLPLVPAARFDLIVVVRFLDRALFPWIASALAPGGRLFYATFNRGHLVRHPGFNPNFVLDAGELAAAFAALEHLAGGEEEGMSWLLAQRGDS